MKQSIRTTLLSHVNQRVVNTMTYKKALNVRLAFGQPSLKWEKL